MGAERFSLEALARLLPQKLLPKPKLLLLILWQPMELFMLLTQSSKHISLTLLTSIQLSSCFTTNHKKDFSHLLVRIFCKIDRNRRNSSFTFICCYHPYIMYLSVK